MKYLIYCRKSTDTEDKQVLSLESQENELRGLAEANNLEIAGILSESMSAKEPGRPVFNKLMSSVASGKADAILCWKIDRLARNPVDGGQIQWLLQTGKIKCIRTFEKSYYPNDNVLLMSIEQAMANQYIRDLSTNVKRGNRAKLERGEWPSHAPFGYLNDKATKTIVIDPARSKYVKRAYQLYLIGSYSFKDISDILYKEGLRSKAGKKVLKSQMYRILTHPFYTGVMVKDGKYYIAKHERLISKNDFEKVRTLMEERLHPKPQKLFFPLRGLLRCESCGCSLTASLKKGHHYYYCTNGKQICFEHTRYFRENFLYQEIANIFERIDFTERKIEIMYKAAKERVGADSVYLAQTLNDHRSQLEALSTKEKKLLNAFIEGQISQELYNAKVVELQNERVSLNQEIRALELRQPQNTLEPIKDLFLQASRAKNQFLDGDDRKKREIVESLLWNLSFRSGNVAQIKLKSPFDVMYKAPKEASFVDMLPDRDSNPN